MIFYQSLNENGFVKAEQDSEFFFAGFQLQHRPDILSYMRVFVLQVTECEIFLSLLVKFLDGEKPQWLRAVAVESVHRLCVQPHLLR